MAYFTIQDILLQWQSIGVFDYLLPFLLILAIVFGILSYLKIFGDNRGVHIIISFVIALLSLNSGFIQAITAELFPRLGVGLVVILTVLILTGMFIADDERRFWGWGLAGLAVVIAIIVLFKSFDVLGWIGYYGYGGEMIGWVIGGIIFIILMIAVFSSNTADKKKPKNPDLGKATFKALFGD